MTPKSNAIFVALIWLCIAFDSYAPLAIATWGFGSWPTWDFGLFLAGFIPSLPYLAAFVLFAVNRKRMALVVLVVTFITAVAHVVLLSANLQAYLASSEKPFWK